MKAAVYRHSGAATAVSRTDLIRMQSLFSASHNKKRVGTQL
jgi:hypothetical protein